MQLMMERKSKESPEERGKSMKRILLTAVLGMLLTFAFMPPVASADWGFSFGDNGWNPANTDHYNFSKIDFIIPNTPQNAGITWSGNGLSNFSQTGWSAQKINQNYVVATGPAAGILFWNFLFTGTETAPANFMLNYVLYNAEDGSPAFGINMFVENGQPNFSQGTGWTPMDSTQLQAYSQSSVPVPSALLLLGTGLVGLAAVRKRIHR
jgi:hypothetical protein